MWLWHLVSLHLSGTWLAFSCQLPVASCQLPSIPTTSPPALWLLQAIFAAVDNEFQKFPTYACVCGCAWIRHMQRQYRQLLQYSWKLATNFSPRNFSNGICCMCAFPTGNIDVHGRVCVCAYMHVGVCAGTADGISRESQRNLCVQMNWYVAYVNDITSLK